MRIQHARLPPGRSRRVSCRSAFTQIRMIYHWLADTVVLFHATFVLFVIVGGFLALLWRRLVWLHIPAAIWGVLIEFGGWICPLTPLENLLRARAGVAGYSGGFIEHYVLRRLYPAGLTTHIQWALGALALAINVAAYTMLIRQRGRSTTPDRNA